MRKENEFESTIKWFLYGSAGICAFFQLMMLFSEFSFYGLIGNLFNGIYHLAGILCSIFIIVVIFKGMDDQEVYTSYSLILFNSLGIIVDICLFIKYIKETQKTEGLKAWLIIFVILLIIIEAYYLLILFWYGIDKVTSFFVLLMSIFIVFYKGCIINSIDSKFQIFAYKTVDKSIFSLWTFLFLMFYLALIVFILLYLDYRSLLDVIKDPINIISKKSLFGTYTNLYINNKNPFENSINNNISNSTEFNNYSNESNTNIGTITTNNNQNYYVTNNSNIKCPLCGNDINNGQNKCLICGYVFTNNNA